MFNFHTIIVVTLNKKSNVDSLNSGRYTALAAAKSAVGIGVPESITAHNRAIAVFLCVKHGHIRTMVGRAGASSEAPGSVMTGYANLARLITLEIGVSGDELSKFITEAVVMTTILTQSQPEITVINGQAVTSSLAVADYFTKRHERVLDKIRNLECSPAFAEHNFVLSEYIDATGRKLPCYQITRDGFAFLAMGFTGKRAAQFKEAYITAFNRMESKIASSSSQAVLKANANSLYLCAKELKHAWSCQLRPVLMAMESPLASLLNDRFKDAVLGARVVNSALNGKKGGRK